MARGKAGRTVTSPMSARLGLVGEIDGEPICFVLKPGNNTIGALADNDFVITARGVSHQHAVVTVTDEGVTITDRASRNGTLINGVRANEALVKVGDLICLGPVVLRLEAVGSGKLVPQSVASAEPHVRGGHPRPRTDQPTPPTKGTGVSQRWFGALDRIGDILSADPDPGIAKSLEVLVSALGAVGAAFLTWDRSSEIRVIRHTAGNFRPPTELDDLLRRTISDKSKRGIGLVVRSRVEAGQIPVALAVATDDSTTASAVAALGEFPLRDACGRFLELFLKLVMRSLPNAPPAESARLRRPVRDLVFPEGYVVGRSDPMMSVFHQLRHLLSGDLPVLITGETGVGKEFIARILHSSSRRSAGPFVAVNCAALPADLLEAELFGIEGGVATGVSQREGKMQLADGGVVFLDEDRGHVRHPEPTFLRALQEKEVHPVGAKRPVPLDVRVVAATNTNLLERIGEGRFRSDLYYRIAGYTLHVPPLRERRGDIAALIETTMRRVCRRDRRTGERDFRQKSYGLWWMPMAGQRARAGARGAPPQCPCPPDQPITVAMVSPSVLVPADPTTMEKGCDRASDLTLSRHVDELERRLIVLAMARTAGKRATAARLLGISRYGLTLKIQRLGIDESELAAGLPPTPGPVSLWLVVAVVCTDLSVSAHSRL